MGDVTGGLWPEAPVLAAWLLTFAVHSTVLLGVLWLSGRWLANLTDPVQEALVKFALVASLCSATLQVVLGAEPAAGHLVGPVVLGELVAKEPARHMLGKHQRPELRQRVFQSNAATCPMYAPPQTFPHIGRCFRIGRQFLPFQARPSGTKAAKMVCLARKGPIYGPSLDREGPTRD